eukprot:g17813.t1
MLGVFPDATKAGLHVLNNLINNDQQASAQIRRWVRYLLCSERTIVVLGEKYARQQVLQNIGALQAVGSNGLNLTATMKQTLRALHILAVVYANAGNAHKTPDSVLTDADLRRVLQDLNLNPAGLKAAKWARLLGARGVGPLADDQDFMMGVTALAQIQTVHYAAGDNGAPPGQQGGAGPGPQAKGKGKGGQPAAAAAPGQPAAAAAQLDAQQMQQVQALISAAFGGLNVANYQQQIAASDAIYGQVNATHSVYDTTLARAQDEWMQSYGEGQQWYDMSELGVVWRSSQSEQLTPPQGETLMEDDYAHKIKCLAFDKKLTAYKDQLDRLAQFLHVRENTIAHALLEKMPASDRSVYKKVLALLLTQGIADETSLLSFATLYTPDSEGNYNAYWSDGAKSSTVLTTSPENNAKWFDKILEHGFTAAESFRMKEALKAILREKLNKGLARQGPGAYAGWNLGVLCQFMGRCRERQFRTGEGARLPSGLSWLMGDNTYEPSDQVIGKLMVLLEERPTIADAQEQIRLQRARLNNMPRDTLVLHVVPIALFMLTAHDEPSAAIGIAYHPECRALGWIIRYGLKYIEEIIAMRQATHKSKTVPNIRRDGNGPYDGPGSGPGGAGPSGNQHWDYEKYHSKGTGKPSKGSRGHGGGHPYSGQKGYQHGGGDQGYQYAGNQPQQKNKWCWCYKDNTWKENSASTTAGDTKKKAGELDYVDQKDLLSPQQVDDLLQLNLKKSQNPNSTPRDRVRDPVKSRDLDSIASVVVRGKMIWVINQRGEMERSIIGGAKPCTAVCKNFLHSSCSKGDQCNNHHKIPQMYHARASWHTVLFFQSLRLQEHDDKRIPDFWQNDEQVWTTSGAPATPLLSKQQEKSPSLQKPPVGGVRAHVNPNEIPVANKPILKFSGGKGKGKGKKGKW